MIKASHSDSPSADSPDAAGRNVESWAKDAQAQSLRVELADDRWFVFPYAHLLVASLQREGNEELLKVCFTTHEVLVRGRNLRALALAVQKLSVDWIRELPPRYEGLAVPDGAFVGKIEVIESEPETGSSAEPG
jgi:hypothetical protein